MKNLIVIFLLFFTVAISCQNEMKRQYLYNKVIDLVICNDGFLLDENNPMLLCNDKIEFENKLLDLLPLELKSILVDTSQFYKFTNIWVQNQFSISQLPWSLIKQIKLDKENLSKIYLSNGFKFKYKNEYGYIIMFKKELMVGFEFPLESEGLVLAWLNSNNTFCRFEYYDNVFRNDPYIKLLETDK